MKVKGTVKGVFRWDGLHYGYCERYVQGNKQRKYYYKSLNYRFDDTCGGTARCSKAEYEKAAAEKKEHCDRLHFEMEFESYAV